MNLLNFFEDRADAEYRLGPGATLLRQLAVPEETTLLAGDACLINRYAAPSKQQLRDHRANRKPPWAELKNPSVYQIAWTLKSVSGTRRSASN